MSEGRIAQLRAALLQGEALTRPEACERFGISGSTFRWLIRAMQQEGVKLSYEEERGGRNVKVRRWKVDG